MNIVAVIAARLNSSRLPRKVLRKVGGKTLLKRVHDAAAESECTGVVVAIPDKCAPLRDYCDKHGMNWKMGREEDVLDRVIRAAKYEHADVVVRANADCPLITKHEINHLILAFQKAAPDYPDYVGYWIGKPAIGTSAGYPELITLDALKAIQDNVRNATEHVTWPAHRPLLLKQLWLRVPPREGMTVDSLADLKRIRELCCSNPT